MSHNYLIELEFTMLFWLGNWIGRVNQGLSMLRSNLHPIHSLT